MADYEINEFGKIVFDNGVKKRESNPLWQEYAQLEYEIFNNQHNQNKDPIKIARYNELKQLLDIEKRKEDFNKAKEKIRQTLIVSDKSNDKTALYTAMTQFKKTNE